MDFISVRDPFGRPYRLRPSAVVAIEGAHDPGDPAGELWNRHPVTSYRRLLLASGAVVYLADEPALVNLLTREDD